MSLKYATIKHSENHYVLPRTGTMKVDVHAFLSENLYQKSEESLWQQAMYSASYEGVIGMYLMPDCHSGYSVPVGSVVVTDDTVIQAGSGYDISCGVIYMKVPGLTAGNVKGRYIRERWVTDVERHIATGLAKDRPKYLKGYTSKEVDNILRYGAKALGIRADLCERQYIPVDDTMDLRMVPAAYEKCARQLGSVGSGNHFIEMQVDRDDGSVWVMIHCGSRGYGYKTAEHFFRRGAQVRGLPSSAREQSWLRLSEDVGKEYWNHHNSAANYAVANRHIIVEGVNDALEEIFNVRGEVYYEISHNLVQQETVTLPDGTSKTGFVHRKGATRAFPAGHPSLKGTAWETTGHPCLIPGSMYDGAAILFAQPEASKSMYSVNHGSGRIMARNEAKRKLSHKQEFIDDQMKTVVRDFNGVKIEGIVGNTKHTPLDECAHVYKNLDEVLGVLEAEGIAKVARRLFPVANLKGAD